MTDLIYKLAECGVQASPIYDLADPAGEDYQGIGISVEAAEHLVAYIEAIEDLAAEHYLGDPTEILERLRKSPS